MVKNKCNILLDICGLNIYNRNAFRLLGADVDIKGRRIKRNEVEFKAAIEVGELADEYCSIFRPNPLPTHEELSEAARSLTDVQQRFIHEFFWFWPLEWGKSASDEALNLIKSHKVKEAKKLWGQIARNGDETSLVAKHNLAVLGHWLALDHERKILTSKDNIKFTHEKRKELNAYWNFAFKNWESLCADEPFWSVQADRIRALDDPRLTSGFLHSFCQSLPIAFDNINADLAVAYCDREMYIRAKDHIQIMKATNAGYDDVDTSLRRVTEPLHSRIDRAIETATSQLHNNKTKGKERCIELFNTCRQILNVMRILLGKESQEFTETCDRVANSMLQCQVSYGTETKDWKSLLSLLEWTRKVARKTETLALIEQSILAVRQNNICWFCEKRTKSEQHSITVHLKKSIKWQDIKRDPEKYRPVISQIVQQLAKGFLSNIGQMNISGMHLLTRVTDATKRGDYHEIVSAIDVYMNDWVEIMSQQATKIIPRCRTCASIHSAGAGALEPIDAIQTKLETANAEIESVADTLRSLKEKIASFSQDPEDTSFLRKRIKSSRLDSLRRQEEKWKLRHQAVRRERARLQSQLKQRKSFGNVKEFSDYELWPPIVEAKKDGFRIT